VARFKENFPTDDDKEDLFHNLIMSASSPYPIYCLAWLHNSLSAVLAVTSALLIASAWMTLSKRAAVLLTVLLTLTLLSTIDLAYFSFPAIRQRLTWQIVAPWSIRDAILVIIYSWMIRRSKKPASTPRLCLVIRVLSSTAIAIVIAQQSLLWFNVFRASDTWPRFMPLLPS